MCQGEVRARTTSSLNSRLGDKYTKECSSKKITKRGSALSLQTVFPKRRVCKDGLYQDSISSPRIKLEASIITPARLIHIAVPNLSKSLYTVVQACNLVMQSVLATRQRQSL